ncbi:hypothetical protein GCM10028822_30180 [Hymenobacter terrigena]
MESDYTQLKQVAREYLQARHDFLTKSAAYPELAGNDNLMGRIGEMVAVQFLRSQGRSVDKHEQSNHPVTDLQVVGADGVPANVSVKLISAENKRGATTALKAGWDEFVLVELQANYTVKRLGWLTMKDLCSQQQEALVASSPITKRRMLDADGLLGRFGRVYDSANASDAPMLKALL